MDPRRIIGRSVRSISTSRGLNAMTEFCRAVNPNNPAATRVGSGLRSLVSISQALGKGGKLPVSIDNINSDVKWVLDTLGINSQSLFKAGQGKIRDPETGELRNKTIAEAATEAAKGVFDRVKNGRFTINDIPIFRPPLEDAYRVARADTLRTFNEVSEGVLNKVSASPYAVDLDRALPKYKFLFVVQFTFSPEYMQDQDFQRKFAFVIKQSTRPSVKYTMEDVNYYNFRTKVTTKAEFEEMNMEFYDDGRNSVHALYTAYTRAMSPVLNYASAKEMDMAEMEGMAGNFSSSRVSGIQQQVPVIANGAGSTGPLANDNKNIIREIKLYHVYDNGRKVNIYTFINPRITSFELDDLDMAVSDINMVEMKFNYDSVHTEVDVAMNKVDFGALATALYPLRHVGNPQPRGQINYAETDAARIKRNGCFNSISSFVTSAADGVSEALRRFSDEIF